MLAASDYLAVLDDEDKVTAFNRAYSLRDSNNGGFGEGCGKRKTQICVGFVVKGGGGVVENKYLGTSRNGAGDKNALSLTAREVCSSRRNAVLISVRKRGNKIVSLGDLCRLFNVFS